MAAPYRRWIATPFGLAMARLCGLRNDHNSVISDGKIDRQASVSRFDGGPSRLRCQLPAPCRARFVREQPTLHSLLFVQPRRRQILANHWSLAKEAGVSGRHCCIRFIHSLSAVSIQLYALPIVAAHHGPGCRRYWIDVLGVPAFAAHLDQWLEVACGDHEPKDLMIKVHARRG